VNVEMLLSADEVFLTNVIRGIQPVTDFREANYTTQFSRKLFDKLVSPLASVEQSAF
jgi:branched-subunit amino acid aminotransferase/4-amino-4-deoxychorismate lyase